MIIDTIHLVLTCGLVVNIAADKVAALLKGGVAGLRAIVPELTLDQAHEIMERLQSYDPDAPAATVMAAALPDWGGVLDTAAVSPDIRIEVAPDGQIRRHYGMAAEPVTYRLTPAPD